MPQSRREFLAGGVGAFGVLGALAARVAPDSGPLRESSDSGPTPEFPEGPKSRPERPADPTAESARRYAEAFEYRRTYNRVYSDPTDEIRVTCGTESVARTEAGFRVVVRCSASATADSGTTAMHADRFLRYATYLISARGVVRRPGRSKARTPGSKAQTTRSEV